MGDRFGDVKQIIIVDEKYCQRQSFIYNCPRLQLLGQLRPGQLATKGSRGAIVNERSVQQVPLRSEQTKGHLDNFFVTGIYQREG